MNIERLSPEVVKDLIPLVNSLGSLRKTAAVKYGSTNFQYVPLDDMLAEVKKDNNFAFMQPLGMGENGEPYIQCLLIHKSGEIIMSDPYRLVVKQGAKKQEEGAEITYSRRYSMASFFGIASDEDIDAQSQQEYQRGNTKTKQTHKPKRKNKLSEDMSHRLNEALFEFADMTNQSAKQVLDRVQQEVGKSAAEMDEQDGQRALNILANWKDKALQELGA